ncbi:hypothetical protein HKD37_07G018477 [Glycine soja]
MDTITIADSGWQQWKPPAIGYLKCNLDATFFKDSNCVGLWCCIRDHAGNMIVAHASPPASKLWKEKLSLYRVLFSIVDKLNNTNLDSSECGTIIFKSQSIFVMRLANEVVHALAKVASTYPSFQVFSHVPQCIAQY